MSDLATLVFNHTFVCVLVVTFAARVGLPVPAAPLLLIAGALAYTGQIPVSEPFLGSFIANILGDGVWFLAGRRWGGQVLRLLCRISLSPDACIRQAEMLVSRWGGSSLIAAKFVPGISVVAAPMAGALQMSTVHFLEFGAIAAFIWTATFMLAGALFSHQLQAILDFIAVATGPGALAVVLTSLVLFVLWRFIRRRRAARVLAVSRVDVAELIRSIEGATPPVVVDVRSNLGRQSDPRQIPGAISKSLESLQYAAMDGLICDREIVLYCDCPNDETSARAAHSLQNQGYLRVRALRGGLNAWVSAGQPTEGVSGLRPSRFADSRPVHS